MRRQAKQFFALAGLTAVESTRQPISLLLVTACCVLIALLPFLITHTLGEPGKLVRDSALAFHMIFGLLLGSFISTFSLTHEIQRGTASSILSKPVGRTTFFLAKYCGMAGVMLLFSLVAALSTTLSARASSISFTIDWWAAGPLLAAPVIALLLAAINNYFTRRPFVSNAFGLLVLMIIVAFVFSAFVNRQGEGTTFGASIPLLTLPASFLVALAILVLSGIALALATRLQAISIVAICSLILFVGLMSDYLFGRHAAENVVARTLYYLIPNWQHFWAADALSGQGTIPWAYVGSVTLYALFYLAGVLGLGILSFQQREMA